MIDTKNSINNIKDKISANRIVERLRFAGTKIHVGFFDMDIFEKNLFFSKETYRILGYDLEEELSNKHIILEHIHPKEVSRYKKAIENLKENNKEIEKKFKFINKKTKEIIVCLLSLSIFYDEKNPRIIGTIKDITELENFHKNLKKDKKKVEEISKAKSFFLAKTSHDLRQPVQALRMFIHSIEKQDLDEKTSKILNNIDILSNNLSNLIDNLLDISKLDYYENKYDFYNFNIKDALYLMLEEFKLISEAKGIKFILNIENIELFSDEILIERMLRNLLTNAFKFTKDEVVISISKERDSVVFSIKDNGIGISDEDKKLIFEEFFQSKNINKDKKDGVGLGLPIVKKICEIIKAKIDIISTFDKGTEFIISIEA